MNIRIRPWPAGLACVAALLPPAAPAQAPAELQALRAEIAVLRQDYAARVAQLEQRIEQLEATVAPAPAGTGDAALVADAAAAMATPAAAPITDAFPASAGSRPGAAFNPSISVILTGTYADLSQDPGDYRIAGFFPAGDEVGPGERGFGLGESEVTLAASVDPYFTAALTAALAGEGGVEVEEAYFRTTALPAGLSIKGGRYFSGIGYLNEVHAHAWDFVDPPLSYQAFFGGQLRQDGLQLKWLAPTDLFLELGAEAASGESFPATRGGGSGLDTVALFAHVGGDLGGDIGWRAGLSWVDADALDRAYDDAGALGAEVTDAFSGRSRTWLADVTLKWSPGGDARHRSLELQAEYLRRDEDGRLAYDVAGAALDGRFRSTQEAWYAQAVHRFASRWRAGVRFDALDSGTPRIGLVADGTLAREHFPLLAPATPSRTTLMVDWSPSEFSRLRAQYVWDDARDAGQSDEQWLLQYVYALGAHGAHKF